MSRDTASRTHPASQQKTSRRPAGSGADFSAAESFILYALRAWTQAAANSPGSPAARAGVRRWTAAFHHIAAETAEPLDQFLILLARNTRRRIQTGCPCCGRASLDELRLLAYLGACRHRMDGLAAKLIGYWLPQCWQTLAVQHGREFVLYLASKGYELPAPKPSRLKRIAVESLIQASEIRADVRPNVTAH